MESDASPPDGTTHPASSDGVAREVDEALLLSPQDDGRLPGLYRLNVVMVPALRLLGFNILLGVAAIHNHFVLGGVDGGAFLRMALFVEIYSLGSWALLHFFFTRSRNFHLGNAFIFLDLLPLSVVILGTGGSVSLLWPVYLVRVADQLWSGRRHGAQVVMAVVLTYSVVAVYLILGGAADPVAEIWKVCFLAGTGSYLLAAAGRPMDLQERALAVREWVVRLDRQSRELEEARDRAEAASLAKSDFLARMSHELRTPLNSIIGFTRILMRPGAAPMGSRERGFLDRIHQNGLHLLTLINDILDLARIEQGRLDVQITRVDLGSLVRETVRQLEGRMVDSNASMDFRVPPRMALIDSDEIRLRQVLVNLIGNAVKFTDEGWVRVEVVTEDVEGSSLPIPLEIRVQDTGVGIPADRLERVFEAFEQGPQGATVRTHPGTGLGLAISRSICQALGYTLTVESQEGVGSTFVVGLDPNGTSRTAVGPGAS